MGASEGVAYPSLYHFLSTWIPANERARGIALMISGTHVGTTIALITSPIIIRHASWQAIFYSFGLVGFVWVAAWHFIAYDRDEKNAGFEPVSLEEGYTSSSSSSIGTSLNSNQEVRLIMAILRNKRTLAVCQTQAVFGLVHYVILSWLPSYFKNVYSIQTTDLSFTFVPYFSMAVSGNIGGYLADALLRYGMTLTRVRKTVTLIANLGAAVLLVAFAAAKTVHEALMYISLSLAFMSLNSGGYASSFMDMAAPSVVGIFKATSNTMASFAGFISIPLSTKVMDWLGGSWRGMFASLSLGYLYISFVFCAFVESERVLDEQSGVPSKRAAVS
ncbi:putative anion transporter 1, chloroplastic [Gracilariopsis chorda]|uniref:Putative anion transporter 1, chloroplastic n=1 Tax=Gracilariopsis chorda TaxID=448386 RepID=A0A2V3IXL5_9FLOR|nr:putative anion transporter 1, chloroplastic [Gracilariopsis chorda]|eukprot:PXF46437.1 putative anion transporter 1, chloroplastic [Gracilariopsis chorda]